MAEMRVQSIPWGQWLSTGLSLGLSPEAFWALSLREWRGLTAPLSIQTADRATLTALIARFPDTNPTQVTHNGPV
jgi:uncharacterized phage protein (TIGR02216 family)